MIELVSVSKSFDRGSGESVQALKPVDLFIKKGEFVVLLGSNGSGKSTLLNLIAGTYPPDSGKVMIAGNDVTSLKDFERSSLVSRIFQDPLAGTASDLSILDNFRLAAIRTKTKGLRIGTDGSFRKLVEEKIGALGMGLEKDIDRRMGSLSGGQRQALTLLMAVMDDTRVLLMDEPTAALDPRSGALVMETALRIIENSGLTAIMVTHNLHEAHRYGNRLVMLGEGKVAKDLDETAKKGLQLPDLLSWFA